MAPHQFSIQVVENIRNGEVTLVCRHFGIKQHLQQKVAQFFGQVGKVTDCSRSHGQPSGARSRAMMLTDC